MFKIYHQNSSFWYNMTITIGLKIAEEGKIFFCNTCNRYVRKKHLLLKFDYDICLSRYVVILGYEQWPELRRPMKTDEGKSG